MANSLIPQIFIKQNISQKIVENTMTTCDINLSNMLMLSLFF
jgi:hypothetical protein